MRTTGEYLIVLHRTICASAPVGEGPSLARSSMRVRDERIGAISVAKMPAIEAQAAAHEADMPLKQN